MYADTKPCTVCGSPVTLRQRTLRDEQGEEPVGPRDGVVGTADPTVDERVCTNGSCPTHQQSGPEAGQA